MRRDIGRHVDLCASCVQHKGPTGSPAPILPYPIPERPFDVAGVDLLKMPTSATGAEYFSLL